MGKYTRVFEVEMGNVKVSVSPLTCGQTDDFLAKQSDCLKIEDLTKRMEALTRLNYEFVMDGLNNANAEEKWTVERIRAEMDKTLVAALKDRIMEESGLTIPKQEIPKTS